MSSAKILIVDNEPGIRFVLEHTLKHENYLIDTAANGEDAIRLIKEQVYDLILLDLQMEPIGGMQVLNVLRQESADTVVIILTAHGSMESAVQAVRLEAFDYLFKPAMPETIRKRVREGLERRQRILQRQKLVSKIETLKNALNDLEAEEKPAQAADKDRFLSCGKTMIDLYHREVTLEDHILDLTSVEFNILVCLVQAAPKVVTPCHLVKTACGYETSESEAGETIKVYIHHLRQKMEKTTSSQYIKTIRGQGYLWCG